MKSDRGWRVLIAVPLAAAMLQIASSQEAARSAGQDFESESAGSFPSGWVSTSTRPILPATIAAPGANGSRQSLLLGTSSPRLHQGASIWHALPVDDLPLDVELSFAFGGGEQRVMRLWTAAEDSSAPTQLNLTLENKRLRQFHPVLHQWTDIGEALTESPGPEHPVWYRLRIVAARNANAVAFWLSRADSRELPEQPIATLPAYRTGHALSRIHIVNERQQDDSFVRLDDIVLRADPETAAPALASSTLDYRPFWSGPPIPESQDELPTLDVVTNVTVHAPRDGQYTFLHGVAIVHHKGRLYANWANSPVHENSPDETLQGSTSSDSGLTWTPRQIIARSPENEPNFSHAAYLSLKGELWTFAARFRGLREGPGVKFPDLQVEALVLDENQNKWISRGTVAKDMWPYMQPIRLRNGNWITAGQGTYGEPGVLISDGDNVTRWRTIQIPMAKEMPQGFGETTLLPIANGTEILALVRPGGGTRVAWASVSRDFGETWTPTRPTNYPIGISKMYAGRLSTGQPYVVANFASRGRGDRDTLVVSVGEAGADTVNRMYQVRFGPTRPAYSGFAKGAQWSYPYAHEYDGKLFIVYSVNKEEAGLSIVPMRALAPK